MPLNDIRLARDTAEALRMLDNKIERNTRRPPLVIGALVGKNADQAIAANTWTALTFNTVLDKQGDITVSGNTITIKSDGVYSAGFHCRRDGTYAAANVEMALASSLSAGAPTGVWDYDQRSACAVWRTSIERWFAAGSVLIPYVYSTAAVNAVVNPGATLANMHPEMWCYRT
ncbi:hypothetical protein ACWEOE_10935 [Amycolatopsis sp. NPDC004368]